MLSISHKSRLPELERQIAAAALDVALTGATATVQEARRSVEEVHGAGIHYPGQPHPSSAPGQAPQSQFGDLLGTIELSQEDVEGIGANAVAGDGSGVAFALESGTSNIEPRPFMGPAAEVGTAAAEARLVELGKTIGRA